MRFLTPKHVSGDFGSLSAFLDRWFPSPLFLRAPAAGVDVSDVSIKWMVFEPTRRIRLFGTVPLKEGVVVGGVIKDVDALAEALRELPKVGITEAHAALPEETAYVFSMNVPADTTHEQTLRMIEFEFEGRVPISPKASVYDFDVVSRRGESNMREIGVVVFPRELAENYVAAFAKAGVRLLSLELEARSIARAVHVDRPVADNTATLLVDFGRLRSGIAILKNGVPIFTATIELGGAQIEQGLAKILSCSPEETESFRNNQGLLADSSAHQKELEVVVGTASALTDEVSRHFHFWDAHKGERGERSTPVSRVILVGGSSNLRGLEEYMASRVQVSVERGDVWHNIFSYDEYIPPIPRRASLGYATAVGLAMRGLSLRS